MPRPPPVIRIVLPLICMYISWFESSETTSYKWIAGRAPRNGIFVSNPWSKMILEIFQPRQSRAPGTHKERIVVAIQMGYDVGYFRHRG
jgi:hypothetical protein